MVQLKTLINIAAYGGFALVGTGYVLRILIDKKMKSSVFYQDALAIVKEHPVVQRELGEPIIDLKSKQMWDKIRGEDKFGSWTRIPLQGPKSKGTMKFWVAPNELDMTLNRVEVEFDHIKNKSLLVKKTQVT